MPTYDYHCNGCGDEQEYRNLSSRDTPSCYKCGSDDMKRLPSSINIGGMKAREVSMGDIYAPQLSGLEILSGEVKTPDKKTKPALFLRPVFTEGGPSAN